MTTNYSEMDDVTLGDKKVEISNFDRYKGRKGVTDRIVVVSSKLIRGFTYYHNESKKMFRAPKDPATLKACKEAMGEPQQRFGIILFQYLTDETGDLANKDKLQGKLKLWVVSESRYEELSLIQKDWKLLDDGEDQPQNDLKVKCTEEQYQRMSFNACPEALYKTKPAWYKKLKEMEAKAKDKLKMAIGRELPDGEIMDILGQSGPSPTSSASAGDIDLSDVLDDDDTTATPAGTAPTAAASGEEDLDLT